MTFYHDQQELCGDIEEFTLSAVCEADEVYLTAGETVVKTELTIHTNAAKKARGRFEFDKPSVLTLVPRDDGLVRLCVRKGQQNVNEDIAEFADVSVSPEQRAFDL